MANEEIRTSFFGGAFQSVRFVFVGYDQTQMRAIGDGFLKNSILPRIRNGLNVYDQPARALSPGYLKQKLKAGGKPIRDWNLTGRLMRSTRVTTARDNYAVLGATDAAINDRLFYNNRRERQFGVSPNDRPGLSAEFAKQPPHTRAQVVK